MGFFGFGKKKAFSQPASSWVDDDDGESLSVYDAALIWMSNDKDEDYTFGYSEEELEDALR